MSRSGEPAKQDTLFVASLAKGLKVLAVFGEGRTDLSLGEIASLAGLDKSAAQRLTNTLHRTGYLGKNRETKRYRPTLRMLEFGSAYLWSDALVPLAMPKLIELSRDLGERVNCARLFGQDIVYIIRIPTQLTSIGATIPGRRVSALTSAGGRAMISALPDSEREAAIANWRIEARTAKTVVDRGLLAAEIGRAALDGYALTDSQNLLNEIAVAAPILDGDRRPVACVQCSLSSHKLSVDQIRRTIAPKLIEVANSIQAPRLVDVF
ncbi:helix-turn-helix domain-containing protein [Jiella sp. 40Bstr34]|uniref:Helix-turn-helix domain-containing protein n=2 Tax=Jiella pacifica TaxID=2696469 RepID=A0A6N9T7B6_9HYPH|nr:helix-turn-helix domain-containing protein [Jiella pacifica]